MRRAYWIHERLGNGIRANANSLAEELEVSPRTIKRDIDELRDTYNAPIEWEPSTKTYFYSKPFEFLPLLRLSADEALALELAGRTFSAWAGSPLGKALTSAFGKIGEIAGGAVSVPADQLATCISAGTGAAETERRFFAILLDAIRMRREMQVSYLKPGARRAEQRTLHPLHLAYVDQGWMLVAYDTAKHATRNFLLIRIRGTSPTGLRFAVPVDFDAQAYLAGSFGRFTGTSAMDVCVRFDAYAAPYVRERKWHPTQSLAERPDGSMDVTLQVNHLLDVQRWVLSWGSHAEALAPQELRDSIAREITTLAERYKTTPQIPTGR